jgi:methionine-rich copper-binding protein CopC
MPAHAHTSLVSSDPTQGSRTEKVPERIVLTFSEDLRQPSEASLLVDGAALTAEIKVDGPRVVLVPPADAAAGSYEVNYRVVSTDGHPVTGTLEFTVGPEDAVAKDDTSATAAEEPAQDEGSVWTSPLLLGVLVAAVALGAAALLLVRGRFSSSDDDQA